MPAIEFPEDIDARITEIIKSLLRVHIEMVRYADSIVHDRQAAEDIVQDCYIKLLIATLKKKKRFLAIPPDKRKGYFYKMIKNACIDWLRKPEKLVFDSDQVATIMGSLSDEDRKRQEIFRDVVEHFHKKFETLNDNDKKVCVNRFLIGMEVKEIAKRMKLTPDQVAYKIRVLKDWFKSMRK